MTIFALHFGTIELATQRAAWSIASLTYTVLWAVSVESSTRIANFIGGKNLYSAKMSTHTVLVCGLYSSLQLVCIIDIGETNRTIIDRLRRGCYLDYCTALQPIRLCASDVRRGSFGHQWNLMCLATT